jgi:hypothetical protein
MTEAKAMAATGTNEVDFNVTWKRPASKIGILTLSCAIIASLFPSIYLYIAHGVFPELSVALSAWSLIAMSYVAFYFIEPFSYYPILGLTGTYMSFLTGNISNLRLPASAAAQEAVGVELGSKKAEIVSTLAISGSVITNTIIVTIAVVSGNALISLFPDWIISALSTYTLPAIFGAVFMQFAMNNIKIAAIALPAPLILLGLVKVVPIWITIAASVFLPILISRLFYRAGKL